MGRVIDKGLKKPEELLPLSNIVFPLALSATLLELPFPYIPKERI